MEQKNQPELIQQFQAITNADPSTARFYLEANQWNLDIAVTSFFDNPLPKPPASSANSPGSSIPNASEAVSRSSRIATLSGVNQSSAQPDQSNTYYAGGERSGVALQGPNQGKPKSINLVEDILKQAAENGPRPKMEGFSDEESESDSEESLRKKKTYFTGIGNRLAGGTVATPSSSSESGSAKPHLSKVTRTLTFWKNGFSIEDGPLFPFDDPQTEEILNAMKSGRAPLHILNVQHGQPVDLKVQHKMDEMYKPPPPKPFSGQGQRLGSVTPNITTEAQRSTASSAASSSVSSPPQLSVDQTKPVTTVQIRLADGTRLIAKLNLDHTINDLRKFISSARPVNQAFSLHTTFPMKELKEDHLSIQEAGLANAVVVQKWM